MLKGIHELLRTGRPNPRALREARGAPEKLQQVLWGRRLQLPGAKGIATWSKDATRGSWPY